MTCWARVAVVAVLLCGSAALQTAEARDGVKDRRVPHVTRINVVDWRAAPIVSPCATEIYPYAPSACLPGGFIEFDGKAYFAPRYGRRAHRYADGW